MPLNEPFLPSNGATVTIAVGAAAAYTAIPTGTIPAQAGTRSGGECLEVQNAGTVDVFIETSPGTVAATVANSYPVRAGQCKVIRRAPGDTTLSCIGAAAGPTTLYVTAGNGI